MSERADPADVRGRRPRGALHVRPRAHSSAPRRPARVFLEGRSPLFGDARALARGGDRRAALHLATLASDVGAATPALAAWAKDLALEALDKADAAAFAGLDAADVAVGRVARRLVERGHLGLLAAAAPRTARETLALEGALEAVARRDAVDATFAADWLRDDRGAPFARGVDAYKCLYALRVARGAHADAARGQLECAARLDRVGAAGAAAALAADGRHAARAAQLQELMGRGFAAHDAAPYCDGVSDVAALAELITSDAAALDAGDGDGDGEDGRRGRRGGGGPSPVCAVS